MSKRKIIYLKNGSVLTVRSSLTSATESKLTIEEIALVELQETIDELEKQKEFVAEMNVLLVEALIYVLKGYNDSIFYYADKDNTLKEIFKLLEKIKQKPIEEILKLEKEEMI